MWRGWWGGTRRGDAEVGLGLDCGRIGGGGLLQLEGRRPLRRKEEEWRDGGRQVGDDGGGGGGVRSGDDDDGDVEREQLIVLHAWRGMNRLLANVTSRRC